MTPEEGKRLDAESAAKKARGIEMLNKALAKHGWRYTGTSLRANGTVIVYNLANITDTTRLREYAIGLHELVDNPMMKMMDDAYEEVIGKPPDFSLWLMLGITNVARRAGP